MFYSASLYFQSPNPIPYQKLTTTLLTINKQQIKFTEAKVMVISWLIVRIGLQTKVTQNICKR